MNDLPERHSPTYPDAMTRPIERPTFEPDYELDGPHRVTWQPAIKRAMSRALDFLTVLGIVAAGFFLARLVLRFFFPEIFT